MFVLEILDRRRQTKKSRGFFPGQIIYEDFKLEKGPTDKAKEPDPGGSDQQNLGFKKLKNRKTDRTVGLIQPYGQFLCFLNLKLFGNLSRELHIGCRVLFSYSLKVLDVNPVFKVNIT